MRRLRPQLAHKLRQFSSRLTRNWVYTARSGLWTGLKRRGGLDFLPLRPMDVDAAFLATLDFDNQVVYDVGGFVGLFTLFFARAVGTNGQVFTFEPVPEHIAAIHDHLTLNQFDRVRVLPYGLGARHEEQTLLYYADMPGYSTAHRGQMQRLESKTPVEHIPITIYPLDDLITQESLPQPDFIKIDVEGMEFAALQGMDQTIRNYAPDLFVELHGFDNETIARWLLERGYHIHQVRDSIDITHANLHMARRFLYAHHPISSL